MEVVSDVEIGKSSQAEKRLGAQKCVACQSPVTEIFYEGLKDLEYGSSWKGRIARCSGCGLIQQAPMLTAEEAIAYYPSNYVHYNAKPTPLRSRLLKIFMGRTLSLLRKLGAKPGMRLLDIGCGGGEKLAILRDGLHLKVVGVEPSAQAASICSSVFGIETKTGFFDPKDFAENSFDFVRINHVIEHVPDPVKLVEDISKVLKPGGFILGETENIQCPSAKLFGKFWSFLHLPFHLLFFEEKTLAAIFQKTSFGAVKIKFVTDPAAWSLSIQNYLRKGKDIRQLPERMPGYLLLTLICVPISWLEGKLGRGPVLEFVARK